MYRKLFLCGMAVLIFAACSGNDNAYQMAPMTRDVPMVELMEEDAADEAWGGDFYFAGVAEPQMAFGGGVMMGGIGSVPPLPNEAPIDADRAPGSASVEWEEIAETGERHIIQNATVELETEEFDGVVTELRQLLRDDEQGYIESEMLTTHGRRRFTIVLRVPAARFEETLETVQDLAEVRSTSSHARDVTDEFYDMTGNLATRRIEEERILALIEEAENIHDLLALETRLSNTRQSIERYVSRLNNMAGQIAFSTITVTLFDMHEEEEPAPAAFTFNERMGDAFGDSIESTIRTVQNIIVFFAGAIIPLGILAVFAAIIFAAVKLIRRKIPG